MNAQAAKTLSKVPHVTFVFWLIKIAATTLGETGGDAVSMSMNLGYLVGTAIFAAIFVAAVVVQIGREIPSHDLLADDHRVDHRRYDAGGFRRPVAGHRLPRRFGLAGDPAVGVAVPVASHAGLDLRDTVSTPKSEMFYWVTIMFSQTLGTALGDWTADTAGLGYVGAAAIFGACWLWLRRPISGPGFPHGAVLGGIRAHPSTGSGGRRLPRQAAGRRRSCVEPVHRFGCAVRVHCRLRLLLPQRAAEKAH